MGFTCGVSKEMSEFDIREDDMSWMLVARGELPELQELSEKVSIALRVYESMKDCIREYDEDGKHTGIHNGCPTCMNRLQLESLINEANSYIMRNSTDLQ